MSGSLASISEAFLIPLQGFFGVPERKIHLLCRIISRTDAKDKRRHITYKQCLRVIDI